MPRTLAVAVLCLTLGACAAAAADPASDTPPRLADGRVAPTQGAGPRYANDAQRLALIEKALAHRAAITAKFPPPVTLCKRVPDGSIKIDGKLDDDAWKTAAPLTGFRLARQGTPARAHTTAMLAWDSNYLYVAFDCPDADLAASLTGHDAELWREDALEVFIDADGGETNYVELEASPRGVTYDAVIADYRPEIDWAEPKDMVHIDIDKSIRIFATRDTKIAVHTDGTLNNPKDTDRGWTCEMAIAWSDLERGVNTRALPPSDGDRLRLGLFRINMKSAGAAPSGEPDELTAWNPTGTWFHNPWSFGHVIFVK